MSLSPFKTINQERIKRRGQGKRRQNNRGTGTGNRGGDRVTEERRGCQGGGTG
jgi:hypothetical protein